MQTGHSRVKWTCSIATAEAMFNTTHTTTTGTVSH